MKKISLGIVLLVPFILWAIVCIYKNITFDIDCGDRIKRAADANTIELATKEMEVVVNYIEAEGMTNGYTSIVYKTPDEDIGFWYNNLKSSLEELKKVNPGASQLEKSNLLMKLRETLLDHSSEGTKVTLPAGISKYPNNVAYAIWLWIGMVLFVFGVFLIAIGKDEL